MSDSNDDRPTPRPGSWWMDGALWEEVKPLARQMRREPTPAEDHLWQYLRRRRLEDVKFRRQHPLERFIVDFFAPELRLVIEVDGAIHQYTPEEDAIRQEVLEVMGMHVLRFDNEDVLTDIRFVLRHIAEAIHELRQ